MARSVKAPVTPSVLVWARETASISLEEAAGRVSKTVTPERLAQWENGEDQPTIAQLRKLSELYRRPLAVFFLPEPPREFAVPRDFRRLPGLGFSAYSPALRYELRAARERRQAALDLFAELEEAPPVFDILGTTRESPAALAARAREALGITLQQQMSWRNEYTALKAWKTAIEAQGVLVFQISEIATSEMRGFSIAELPLPVMAVNRSETPTARIFSMMHELLHLILRKSGVCDFNEDETTPPEERRVEVFCNAMAAELLAPSTSFLAQPEIKQSNRRPQEWDEATISALASRYSVSRIFIVRRLLEHGRCTNAFYVAKQALYHSQFIASREQKERVLEKWGEKRVRILGEAFSRLVLDTYQGGHITLSEALGHLQIKAKHLPQVENVLRGGVLA